MANRVLKLDKMKKEIAEYLSGAIFTPSKSTLLRDIRKEQLISLPGLTMNLISKHLPKQVAMSKGHLDQEFKNLQSTKNISPFDEGGPDDDIKPPQEPRNPKTNNLMCAIIDSKELESKSYSDQNGRFLVRLASGNQYIFILYHYDTNSIHDVPIKSRHADVISAAWQKVFDTLQHHGEQPSLNNLDNECL